jgi:hypothetical protein
MKCQACNSLDMRMKLSLGRVAPVNLMEAINSRFTSDTRFRLDLFFCGNCQLVQIGSELPKEIVFPPHYPYISGSTQILVNNFKEQSQLAIEVIGIKTDDIVIDIGSNDGSLLLQYSDKCTVIGIEPTDSAKIANQKNINTIQEYFTTDLAVRLNEQYSEKIKLVTACNVFAHIPNLENLIEGIKKLIQEQGVFLSESHYLFGLIESLQFDTIYHEHLRYYSAKFLVDYFKKHDLQVFRIDKIDTHGGSIRVWVSKPGNFKVQDSVARVLAEEESYHENFEIYLEEFAQRVHSWRNSFRKLIAELRQSGKKISGLGAPSRSSTLLSFAGMSENDISEIGEISTSNKIGKYMPGTDIKILTEDQMLSSCPDVILILSWHIKDELIRVLKNKKFTGEVLIPLPQPILVSINKI